MWRGQGELSVEKANFVQILLIKDWIAVINLFCTVCGLARISSLADPTALP
jgi:hypothetical protein